MTKYGLDAEKYCGGGEKSDRQKKIIIVLFNGINQCLAKL
jgi:hypothetical protein